VISVAAFDVDGTLTTSDCVVPFLRRVTPAPRLAARLLARPVALGAAGLRRDRDAVKALGARAAFAGASALEVDALAVRFADDVYARRLRDEIVDALCGHLADGAAVVLVSASFEVYLRPLAARLGAHEVLATRLAVGDDGRLTGALDGANCRGPEKVVRLHRWLGERYGGRDQVHLTAYGDSVGDRELLADADIAHWVGGRALRSPTP
jgi:phosphatidylglycerophosphatase C